MLPIFSTATEEQFRDFAGRFRAKLKEKFNIVIGHSKLLHAIAELNGFRNWHSLKATLENKANGEFWIVSIGHGDTWTISALAHDLNSGLAAFLTDVEAAVRLIPEELQWEIVGHDYDALYYGLFFLVNQKPMVSLTRIGQLSTVAGVDIASFDLDNAALAGLCHEALRSVGKEDDAEERREDSLRSLLAIAITSDFTEEVYGNSARDVSAANTDALNALKHLRGSKQSVMLNASIQGGRRYE